MILGKACGYPDMQSIAGWAAHAWCCPHSNLGLNLNSGREFFFDLISKLNDGFNDLLADFFRCRNLVGLNRFLKLFAQFKHLWRMHVGNSTFEAMRGAEQLLLIRVSETSRQEFERLFAGRVE